MRDTVRQVAVALSAVLAIVGAYIGSGAAGGTPIQDAAGGALSADATPIAPAGPAFSIWSVIYIGLVAYAVWQLLPKQRTAQRHRRLGWWVVASLLLNAAWILSIQFDQLWLSVPVILVLLAVLLRCFVLCRQLPSPGRVDHLLTDGTLGLYLGWVCVATAANITALLVDAGFTGFGIPSDVWAVVVVAVAGLAGLALAFYGRGRVSPMLSLAWGLAWVADGRLNGEPASVATAVAAITVVVLLVVVTVGIRIRTRRLDPIAA